MKDKQFLTWIHDRLELVHGENHNVDFMHKLRSIIEVTDADIDTHCKLSVDVSGWIGANNPPEETGRYWCYIESQGCLGKSNYQWNCSYNHGDQRWGVDEGTVTHWMPLPSAPSTK